MTPRELSGWVPAEQQTHFNAEGEVVGYTVTERESRIDDADRAELLALAEYEAAVCACGYHPLLATDEANVFKPETHKCPVCAGQAKWHRMLAAEDAAEVKPDAPASQARPSDGRHSYMRMLSPAEVDAEPVSPKRSSRGRGTSQPPN